MSLKWSPWWACYIGLIMDQVDPCLLAVTRIVRHLKWRRMVTCLLTCIWVGLIAESV